MIDREEFEAWARGSDYEVDYVPEFGCYPNAPTEWAWQAWQAARATVEQPDTKPSTEQDWAKLDGAVTFHLIERHAENWADAGAMMDAWRKAKSQQDAAIESKPAEQRTDAQDAQRYRWLRDIGDATWAPMAHRDRYCTASGIDAAIDAAIESQRSGDGS